MKLPNQKKILREDLKDAPSYVNGILVPVNSFMETTYQALNKNLTLQENIASFVRDITYITPAGYPVMENIIFQNQLKSRPIGVIVLQCYEKDTYIPAVGPVYVPWVQGIGGNIVVYPVTGLAASKTYILRVVVF